MENVNPNVGLSASQQARAKKKLQEKAENREKQHRWPKEGRNILGSALFERYYGELLGAEELQTLVEVLRKPLPVTFRFSESNQMSGAARSQMVGLRVGSNTILQN